ncbi:MAG: hypothetical protein OJF62_002432 [Pseudolabrys sp.]|jgi:hypothetical protein|nr:hypothetical protein [Pseudolabrys sp.]
MNVNQERVAMFVTLLSFAFVIAILVTSLR